MVETTIRKSMLSTHYSHLLAITKFVIDAQPHFECPLR